MGRVPCTRSRADIDYATSTAKTTYGTIGVKVWIFTREMTEELSGPHVLTESDAMLAPKRVKFRKRFKGRTKGMATRATRFAVGHYGLMAP